MNTKRAVMLAGLVCAAGFAGQAMATSINNVVLDGTTLTITGVDFKLGTVDPYVAFNGVKITPTTTTNTQIVATIPAPAPGTGYQIFVARGAAGNNAAPDFVATNTNANYKAYYSLDISTGSEAPPESCVAGLLGPITHVTATATAGSGPNARNATAICGQGQVAIGGGAETNKTTALLYSSTPTADGTGFTGSAASLIGNFTLTVTAICTTVSTCDQQDE